MSTAIRFDPATGRLEGTPLPAIPDLIAFARDRGYLFEKGVVWRPRHRCGCWVGLAAIQKDGEAEAFPATSLIGPNTERALDLLGLRKPDSVFGLSDAVGWQVAGSFDTWDDGPPEEYPIWPYDQQQAHLYGQAAGEAVAAAGLWRVEPSPVTDWSPDFEPLGSLDF